MSTSTRRALGASGLKVIPICVGGSEFGQPRGALGHHVPEDQALAALRAVFALRFATLTVPDELWRELDP